jgi:glutamate mutase epsilon subunit
MVEASLKEIAVIAGQKGVITRTKKAIAGFKVIAKIYMVFFLFKKYIITSKFAQGAKEPKL